MSFKLTEQHYQSAVKLLEMAKGESNAMTIDRLSAMLGIADRRATEIMLQTRLQDFPFPLVSSDRGYFIPTSATEINHYRASLRSRAMCIFLRDRTITRKCLVAGFRRAGKQFVDPPHVPSDLFELAGMSQ